MTEELGSFPAFFVSIGKIQIMKKYIIWVLNRPTFYLELLAFIFLILGLFLGFGLVGFLEGVAGHYWNLPIIGAIAQKLTFL